MQLINNRYRFYISFGIITSLCLIFLLFFVLISTISAQNENINETKSKISKLLNEAKNFLDTNPNNTLLMTQEALKLAKNNNLKLEIAKCNTQITRAYFNMSEIDKALRTANIAFEIYKELNNLQGIASSYSQLGQIYSFKKNTNLSLENINKSIEIANKINDKSLVVANYTILGAMYARQSNYKKSLNNYNLALKYIDTVNQINLYAKLTSNVGNIYLELAKFDKALEFYNQAIKINKRTNNLVSLAYNYFNIGVLLTNTKKHNESINYLDSTILILEKIGDKSFLFDAKLLKSLTWSEIKNFDKAEKNLRELEKDILLDTSGVYDKGYFYYTFAGILLNKLKIQEKNKSPLSKNDIKSSIKYLEIAKSNIEHNTLNRADLEIYYSLYESYKLDGNLFKAIENLELYTKKTDTINTNENQKSISEFELNIRLNQNENNLKIKNLELKSSQERQKYFIIGLIISILLITAFIILLIQYKQQNVKLKEINIEMHKLNSIKDRLFSIISHDLLNPIGSFKSVIYTINNNIESFSKSEIKDYFELMQNSTSELYNLLMNLLNWSKSQLGKWQIEKTTFNVNQLIEQNIDLVKLSLTSKNISYKYTKNEDIEIESDRNLLNNVLRNIISNAIKFTPQNGHIDIILNKNQDKCEIIIKDSGIGMTKDKIDNLFKFENIDSTYGTNNETGTGLGLVMCLEFMKKIEGELVIESEINNGTSVKIILNLN